MSSRIRSALAAAIAAAFVFPTACGTTRLGETGAGVPTMDANSQRGELVFMQRCNKCHPDGEAALGPAINGKPLPGWLMRLQIRAGLGAMPAFGENLIDDAAMDDLVSYLLKR